ncbi:MAG: YicC/YloC family endoribonuclease [Bacteroidota bacterium]
MLLSMTGYGKASSTYKDKKISVEIRTLNGKHTDVRFKIPQNYREKEHVLRKLILDSAKRGKIEVSMEVVSSGGGDEYGLNEALFRKYYQALTQLSTELSIPQGDLMTAILRIPNVVIAEEGSISEEEWSVVKAAAGEAIKKLTDFRFSEGKALKNDLTDRVEAIQNILSKVDPYEEERVANLRTRIRQKLDEYMNKEEIDENRFEQEVLFYLEKIDINEEKVRLAQHCKYFMEELSSTANVKGKKLGFISQEIGREINTMGAKAYSHSIQKLVVEMKDELEKIKEQVMNVV